MEEEQSVRLQSPTDRFKDRMTIVAASNHPNRTVKANGGIGKAFGKTTQLSKIRVNETGWVDTANALDLSLVEHIRTQIDADGTPTSIAPWKKRSTGPAT